MWNAIWYLEFVKVCIENCMSYIHFKNVLEGTFFYCWKFFELQCKKLTIENDLMSSMFLILMRFIVLSAVWRNSEHTILFLLFFRQKPGVGTSAVTITMSWQMEIKKCYGWLWVQTLQHVSSHGRTQREAVSDTVHTCTGTTEGENMGQTIKRPSRLGFAVNLHHSSIF